MIPMNTPQYTVTVYFVAADAIVNTDTMEVIQ